MKRARRALDGLDDDIRDHIESETQDNIDRGMAPEEARRQAMLAFGNVALAKEDARAVWRWQWIEQLVQDGRYAFRSLRRRPAYALLSILTLALGIGGTAAVYGVARSVLLAPLPFAHERELGVFWKKTDWTHEEYLHIRGRVPGFRQVALFRQRDVIVREGDGPARLVRVVSASAELFDVLGFRLLGALVEPFGEQDLGGDARDVAPVDLRADAHEDLTAALEREDAETEGHPQAQLALRGLQLPEAHVSPGPPRSPAARSSTRGGRAC